MAKETEVASEAPQSSQAVDAAEGKKRGLQRITSGNKKARLYAIIIILLIAGMVGGYYYLWYKPKPLSYQESFDKELSDAKNGVETASSKEELAQRHVTLGMAYMNKGQLNESIQSYEKALQTSPSVKRQALSGLMYAYAANKQTSEAIRAGEELILYLETIKDGDREAAASIERYQNDVTRLRNGQSL